MFSELDGEITLFQSRTCDYLVLNESGSAIWELLSSERTLNELCQSLCKEYLIEPDICRQDVRDWLVEACHRHVVLVLDPV
ncbi:PqqD family protein [Cyanobium sp. Morenito 9A2]|uniref:PqqD family protein n=1 Tax=Cyanobium sp. Morenito 9A2 TaxID=2823718 RepID=UPI0020CD3014|nr:PqqD family protein [Cyanobium sp. Morenito 9A2]